MIQRDYIMRIIEEMAKAVGLALKLRDEGKIVESLDLVRETYDQLPDIDQGLIRSMSADELAQYVLVDHAYDPGYVETLANLLYEEGEILFLDGQEAEALLCFKKSSLLFEFINKNSTVFSFERINKMQRIKAVLANG